MHSPDRPDEAPASDGAGRPTTGVASVAGAGPDPGVATGCPHCGGGPLAPFAGGRTWTYRGETCGLWACAGCGGWFSHPLPSPEALAALYAADFSYGWYRDHYPAKLADALLRVAHYRRAGWLAGRRILDYGGGLGYFARAAGLLGYQAVTFDPMLDRKATPGEGAQHDTVVMHHVLEHDRVPMDALLRVRGMLAPGGTLVVAVPNAGSLGYRRRGVDFVWSQPPFIHIHHFTTAGLRALLHRAGFAVRAIGYFERWDASNLADVQLPSLFGRVDGLWHLAPAAVKAGVAQLDSIARFAALAASPLLSRAPETDRPELLMVAAPVAGAGVP